MAAISRAMGFKINLAIGGVELSLVEYAVLRYRHLRAAEG